MATEKDKLTLTGKIRQDFMQARKENLVYKGVLTVLVGQMDTILKDKKYADKDELPDDVIIKLIKSLTKGLQETLDIIKNSDRISFVNLTKLELEFLNTYLPETVTGDILKEKIQAIINEGGFTSKDIGKFMSAVRSEFVGQSVEMKEVKTLFDELTS